MAADLNYCLVLSTFRASWWLSGRELACQRKRCEFDSWVRKIPWRKKWQPIPVFLPGKSHGQKTLVGCSPQSLKESDTVQFRHSVVSDSLWPHGLQNARPPCLSATPRVYPSSCPLSWWCHPTIPSSVISFFSCLQSFRASSFSSESVLRISIGVLGQSIGVSASTSVLPMNTHSGLISSRMDWLDLLAVQGTFKSLLEHHSSKASILQCSAFFMGQLSHTAEHNWELSTLISPIRRGVQSP